MKKKNDNTILIIGGPNAGKTHFGGQLYGRLSTKTAHYKIVSPPEDLTLFKEVLDKLNEGLAAGHTHVKEHRSVELQVEDPHGNKSVFSFPDYGGEQVNAIVTERRLNQTWKTQLDKSEAWMLFIRLDELLPIEDVVNRGLPDDETLKQRNAEGAAITLTPPAFYIELLQMLLYGKHIGTKNKLARPRLTVVLSCWDLLTEKEKGLLPQQVLKGRLPALLNFIESNWEGPSLKVIGLSSTGRSLSNEEPDKEFAREGPEEFGYFVDATGKQEIDLTRAIATLIE